MFSNEFLQSLSAKLAQLSPAAAGLQKEVEANIYELLQGSFSKLNLVTREEFDAQVAVLHRAEQTIESLQERIAEMESATTE